LNWLLRKLLPPNMASTRPSRGATATRAAVGPAGFVSHCPIELRAIFWILRSIVVSTFSPPPKTRPDPYRATSCCLTEFAKYWAGAVSPALGRQSLARRRQRGGRRAAAARRPCHLVSGRARRRGTGRLR